MAACPTAGQRQLSAASAPEIRVEPTVQPDPKAAFRGTRQAFTGGGRRAARIGRDRAEAVPGGGSSSCSCGESVGLRLRPLMSRSIVIPLLRGPFLDSGGRLRM
jgi:hypothetical protein